MRSWRNWQTRTVQVRVGDHGGSNPFDRTKTKRHPFWMSFCFHTKTGGIRTREGMSVIRMSCEHSNSEWSEGDRAGSRGGSLQARRSRRSDPFDRTTSQQTTLLSKTGFRPVFSCAPLLLLFPKNLTLFGDPDKKRWMSVCFLRKQEGFEPVRA